MFSSGGPRWPSVVWLMNSLEALIKGEELSNFWRTFQMGNTLSVMQRRGNNHGRFMELLEYGGGGW